jgi:hypothetical protein
MKFIRKLRKNGDSLAVCLNKNHLEKNGMKTGMLVEINVRPAPEIKEQIVDEYLQDLSDKENLQRISILGVKKENLDYCQEDEGRFAPSPIQK